MSNETPWTHPEACPHCQSHKIQRDDDQSTYDCGTVMIALDDFPGFECFGKTVAKLKDKIEALVKAGDMMTPQAHRQEVNDWVKAKEMK